MKQVFLDSVSLEEAVERVNHMLDERGLQSIGFEIVRVTDSLGRVSAGPVFAKYSSPFYHSAAMDGYAVRFADTFTAGETSPSLLRIGSDALYVNTGNPMPDGFNAIVMLEDVNLKEDCIEIYQPVSPYQNVRTIGEDIVATELVIPENHLIRPIDMGAMLSSGHIELKVRKKTKISVIPTGSEIIEPERVRNRPPLPPEIIEYNSTVIQGLAFELGAETTRFPIIADDFEAIKKAILDAAASSDIVVINAGAGRGTEDYTLAAIQSLGEVLVNGVSIRPGKPAIIGIVNNKPVFGLPGYPVSAYITFRLFVKPVIEKLSGITSEGDGSIQAVLSRQVASTLGVDEFVRVKVGVVGGKNIATPLGRGAGLLMSLVRADGMIRIPANSEGLSAGSEVEVDLLRSKEVISKTIVCIGSHDNTLDILANNIKKKYPKYSLSSAHVGSMGGLMALSRGEAHLAGTHLLDEITGEYNISFIKRFLPGKKIVLINLVYRQQGFLLKKGNPKKILGFDDLLRDDVVFINRQTGSGTRLLLDKCLKEQKIESSLIKGYERDEYTHMAVASAVLSGLADTGLGIYSSAKALNLDFLPLASERYDLAVPLEFMDMETMQPILKTIREDQEFRDIVQSMGGYDTRDMGKVIFES
ncbi:MAG: molybdopterin biosynthesis protein [Nitrospirae bacterium]|nr:molybdopterin biosynthesis protein [Nitrospirota bacterium]